MLFYSSKAIDEKLDFKSLIKALQNGFTKDYTIPPRTHLTYDNPQDNNQNTMLLMPAIRSGDIAGVKIVNVAPANHSRNLPSIQGIYYLLDAVTGEPKAIFDAKSLTNWRTAAASALAASYLSRNDAKSLLMIGTGSLAPFIIDAYQAVRPIKELIVYGRNKEKARKLAACKAKQFERIVVVDNLAEVASNVDIISVATLSTSPLVRGDWLKPGQHVDLVGSYRPDMREADDEVMKKTNIYVDNLEMTPQESGDLAIPIRSGVISLADIKGDLFQLCKNTVKGRSSKEEITVFKSVGHALEDVVTAQLILS